MSFRTGNSNYESVEPRQKSGSAIGDVTRCMRERKTKLKHRCKNKNEILIYIVKKMLNGLIIFHYYKEERTTLTLRVILTLATSESLIYYKYKLCIFFLCVYVMHE